MRLPLSALAILAISLPASAGMRAARPQPNAEAMREHVEETAAIRPENAEAYAQQHTFDERMDQSSQKALGSVCVGCSGSAPKVVARVSPPKEMRQATDAETIYRGKRFDRAQARTE